MQTQLEGDGEGKDETLKKIQEILYSTEVSIGFSPLMLIPMIDTIFRKDSKCRMQMLLLLTKRKRSKSFSIGSFCIVLALPCINNSVLLQTWFTYLPSVILHSLLVSSVIRSLFRSY